jgi:hypothetical protein
VRAVKRGAGIVAVYLALAVAMTWPLAVHPASLVAGGARTDAFNSLWNLWFVHDGLATGRFPLHTLLLDSPRGGQIMVADPLNTLLGFPLVSAFGEVAAYAILVIGHLTFAGIAAHLLGRRLGGSGWIAGIGYQWAPIVLSHVQNGSSEAVSAGWLPLAALAVVDAVESGGAARIVRAALALLLAGIGGWYAGIGAFLFASVVGVLGWRGVPWRASAVRAGCAIAMALALLVPYAGAVKSVAEAPDGLVDIKNAEDLARIRRTLGPADPRTFVMPGDFRSPDFLHIEANPSDRVHTTYLGFVLLGLAAWGSWRRRDLPRAVLWVTFAAGVVLAMGPVVVIDGWPVAIHGKALPLPFALLEKLPGFSSLSLLYRLATVSALMLAVLADRARPAWAALVLAEVCLVSPARHLPEVTPIPEQTAVTTLAGLPDGAVINLPILAGRNFLYEQAIHHKPVAGSLNSGVNRAGLEVLYGARLMRRGKLDKPAFVGMAHDQGIRYVLLHKNLLMSETFVPATTAIRTAFTPVAEDDRVAIYQLW